MLLLLWLLLVLVPYFLGRGALRVFYRNRPIQKITCTDSFLAGGIFVIGLAEAAHLGAVLLGRSFSDCVKLFCILTALSLIAAFVLTVPEYRKHKNSRIRCKTALEEETEKSPEKLVQVVYFVFGVLVLLQFVGIVVSGEVYRGGDMTVETVNSFLASDTIYQVNPMTGQAYELGLPLRLKILCLPTLYAVLCRLFGLPAWQVVWVIVPTIVLLAGYLAYFGLSKSLFPKSRIKRGVFLVSVAVILWAGDYMYGMDGFGILYSGFRGMVIRAFVLLPYMFDLCLRKRWGLAILCILAEACIVWTFYGMGVCLLAAVVMLIIQKSLEKKNGRMGREEAPECRNS